MAELWNAFLNDYANEIFDWSTRELLELFWHYCQDGSKAVYKRLNEPKRVKDKEMERLKKERKWVNVKDRLPDLYIHVLAKLRGLNGAGLIVTMILYNKLNEEWIMNCTGQSVAVAWKVTHWMPLPQAPKEGE